MNNRHVRLCTMKAPSENELQIYEEIVLKAIFEERTELIYNNSPQHAAIILKAFCINAKNRIDIFCGRLRKEVYGDLEQYLRQAVCRGVHIRIVTQADSDNIETKSLACNNKGWQWKTLGSNDNIPHLVIVDDNKFRLETDAENGMAIVCTGCRQNQERIGQIKRLCVGFNLIWEAAK